MTTLFMFDAKLLKKMELFIKINSLYISPLYKNVFFSALFENVFFGIRKKTI